ncbi:MAG: Panacea domain-containing protein [Desulfococcaceae bacterium]
MNSYCNTDNFSEIEPTLYEYKEQSIIDTFDKNSLKNTGSKSEDDKSQAYSFADTGSYSYNEDEMISVFDVSAYIVKRLGKMTTMKLQKLVYYCQAWSLVWDEKPLFKEQIEAWANGPVVRELFAFHRGMFQISSVPIGNPDLLNGEQKETIESVIGYYGNKPSQWLIDLTHMEEPWKKARAGLPISVRSNRIISLEDMAEYYSSLPSES